MRFILRDRRSIWCSWRVTLLAPRNVNDVSYAMRIHDEIHFAWQAQYLLKVESDFSWQAQHFATFWEIAGARNVVFVNIHIGRVVHSSTGVVPSSTGVVLDQYVVVRSSTGVVRCSTE